MRPQSEKPAISGDDDLCLASGRGGKHLVVRIVKDGGNRLWPDDVSQELQLRADSPGDLGRERELLADDSFELIREAWAGYEVDLARDAPLEDRSGDAAEQDRGDEDVRVEENAHAKARCACGSAVAAAALP